MSYLAHHLDTYLMGVTVSNLGNSSNVADDSSFYIRSRERGQWQCVVFGLHRRRDQLYYLERLGAVLADEIDDTRDVDDLYTFERNFLAWEAANIDLPSNGMVTSNESDDHREINLGNSVESAARGRLSISESNLNGKRPYLQTIGRK